MDLKTLYVSMQSDIGSLDGNGIELVGMLRENAINELISLSESEIVTQESDFTDSETFEEDPFYDEDEDDETEREPLEEVADTPETDEETSEAENIINLLDHDFGNKINKIATVIQYFDNILIDNGIVEGTDATTIINNIITKFKTIDGIYNTYGEFVFTTEFNTI